MIDHLNVRLNREVGGGVMNIKMHVRDNDLIRKMEKELSDKYRSVSDYGMSIDSKRPDHPWTLIQRIETTWNRVKQRAAAKSSSPADDKASDKKVGDQKQAVPAVQPKQGDPANATKTPKITSTTKK